ncbi:MAG TPA: CapA family protein [Bryobacterales bacterium]|nr:CapA family protein [Bryobacterales bacterium]
MRIFAVGDTAFSGRVAASLEGRSSPIAGGVAALLQSGDIVFGNLEGSLSDSIPRGSLFAAPASAASLLSDSGFTLLHLANNHAYDYGPAGLGSTLAALASAGVTPLGAGTDSFSARRPVRTDRRGLRIGWLGCGRSECAPASDGPQFWEFDEAELLQAVTSARREVDFLVASLHMGFMYVDYPHPDHRTLARRLAQAGADLVLMHHPHVLQGIEITPEGRGICYSLGNFLLDWREGNVAPEVMIAEQNQGAILLFDVDREGVSLMAALPTRIEARSTVQWATGEAGRKILRRLARLSDDLKGDCTASFWKQRSERNTVLAVRVMWFHLSRGHWAVVWNGLKRVRREHLTMLARWIRQFFRHPAETAAP